jgi:glycerone phosphate O-acyltransferase/fatty acyl-CoA reductase
MVAWFLNKVFKRIFEKVIVNEVFLKELAEHNIKKNGPLIFIPTNKSYVDFLLASYVFYAFKL